MPHLQEIEGATTVLSTIEEGDRILLTYWQARLEVAILCPIWVELIHDYVSLPGVM